MHQSHDDRSSDTFENYSWSVRLVRFVIVHSRGTANLEIIVLEIASSEISIEDYKNSFEMNYRSISLKKKSHATPIKSKRVDSLVSRDYE